MLEALRAHEHDDASSGHGYECSTCEMRPHAENCSYKKLIDQTEKFLEEGAVFIDLTDRENR